MEVVEIFQIRCHHLYAYGYHVYKLGDSSIDTVGGDAGKLRRTVTHNPLFFFEKCREKNYENITGIS